MAPTTPLYLVLSETLYERIPILDYGEGPDEPYRICELVAARNRSAAIWAAWRTDRSFENDVREKPRFRAVRVGHVRRPPGVYSSEERLWSKRVPNEVWSRFGDF